MQLGERQTMWAVDKAKGLRIIHLADKIDLRSQYLIVNGSISVSICFWFKHISFSPTYNQTYMFGWRDGGWGGTRMVLNSDMQMNIRYAVGSSSSAFSFYLPSNLFSRIISGEWTHVALIASPSTVKVLINGESVFNRSGSFTHKNDSAPLSIGALGNDASGSYKDRGDKAIAFFCVFLKALSDAELGDVMALRAFSPSDGMAVGYELTEQTYLSDVMGLYPLTLYNQSGSALDYIDF